MPKQKTPNRPNPAAFDDHREYLKAMVDHLKESQSGFSHRQFARRAGFSTSSFLKLVIDGKRNLSQESIGRFAKALGLDAKERDAFEALVMLNQASNDEDRNRYFRQLRKGIKDVSEVARLKRSQYDIYSSWYGIPVREMFLLPDFRPDPEWIARRLRPRITRAEAQKILDRLMELGLIRKTEDGTLVLDSVKLSADSAVQLLAARNYHREMLKQAELALDRLDRKDRNVTSLTVTLTREQYEYVCREIEEFGKNLMNRIEDTPHGKESREVFVMGIQLFPVTGEV